MSAVLAEAAVPRLWEAISQSEVEYLDYCGRVAGTLDVYANWDDKHPEIKPTVHVSTISAAFAMGLRIPAAQARKFAQALMAGADMADATQAALDAEQTQEP